MTEEQAHAKDNIQVKSIVTDKESKTQEAVVIMLPDEDLEGWTVKDEETGRKETVAEQNPGYDSSQNVVIIAYKEDIGEKLKWGNIDHGRLFNTCCEAGVRWYAFPENRLELIDSQRNQSE